MAARLYFVLLIIFGCWHGLEAQNIQLYAEDFNGGIPPYILNDAVGTFTPTGTNKWTINSSYDGGGLYPNTIRQDSMHSGGSIAGAPFSRYLHIHDEQAAPGVSNANFNPAVASDNFAQLDESVCTKAITDVKISFFYLCEGNANAYGELYYSRDGGTWTKVGANQYQGTGKWRYALVQDPAFDDAADLRFAFRWVNTAGATPTSTSFAIDDIFIVGTYDPQVTPLDITATLISSPPYCRGQVVPVLFELPQELCGGTYRFLLSDGNGSFSSPTSLGTLTLNFVHDGLPVNVTLPTSILADTCYKIRVDRIAPAPAVIGTASICFEIIDCPNIITTKQAVVLMDPDTVCVGSVIDVPFNSTGVYESDNVYTAQLSDSNGSFANPYILGSVPDPNAYPAIPPGSVGGLIPNDVPPGCGYYIRIVSSNPVAIGSVYGPICIRDCDITTNKQQDIHVCINESDSARDTVYVDINSWNSNTDYYLGNEFAVEVHSSMNFGLVNIGGLGVTVDTSSTSFVITIPPLADLASLGMMPGMYYIRIVADNSSTPYDSMGTLVRLTIGAPSEMPPVVEPVDSVYCLIDQIGEFQFSPENPNSTYEWEIIFVEFFDTVTVVWSNPIRINISNVIGSIQARVREINFGCYGPWSDRSEFVVLAPPDGTITGTDACVGDTVAYKVQFYDKTYYEWSTPGALAAVDTTNHEKGLRYDSAGVYLIEVSLVNECGNDQGFKEVNVYDYPDPDLGPDLTVCKGEEVKLGVDTSQGDVFWIKGTSLVSRDDTFAFVADNPVTYRVSMLNNKCLALDTINVDVEEPEEILIDSIDFCKGETRELEAGVSGIGYEWNTGATSQAITVDESGEYAVTLLDPNKACKNQQVFNVVVELCGYILEVPNAFTPNGDGLNDELAILGEGYELDYFRIYNRWGELVFETNIFGETWDGTYKDEPADLGVYTWVVGYSYGDERDVLSGNVTLIR